MEISRLSFPEIKKIMKRKNVQVVFISDSSLVVYIHKLIPIKTSKNTSTKYFDCKSQVGSEKAVRAVCYSPEKRVTIQQACENNSPVKISGTKRHRSTAFNANSKECTITRPAKITRTDFRTRFLRTIGNKKTSD